MKEIQSVRPAFPDAEPAVQPVKPPAKSSASFIIEETAEGRNLVVTGDWSSAASSALLANAADGLVLNYARGYRERSLEFLRGDWPVRRLFILARTIKDLSPVYRLTNTLENLGFETSPQALLDLSQLPHLVRLAGDWRQVRETISAVRGLRRLYLAGYSERDLSVLSEHHSLTELTMKEHPQLESLAGIDRLSVLSELSIFGAVRLRNISDLVFTAAASRLQTLQLQSCRAIDQLDAVAGAGALETLNASECDGIESLSPLNHLSKLRFLYLFGTTRVLYGDLSPLASLSNLEDLRMQNRREYKPSVPEIKELIARRHH
jgi:hypothetical protein